MTHIRRSPLVTKERPNDGNKTTITWQSNVECDRCEKWPKRRSSTNTKRGARRAVKWDDRVKKIYAEHTTVEKNGKTTNPHIGWPAPSPKKNKQDTAKSEIMGHDLPPKKNSSVRDSEQTKKTRQHQTMTDDGDSPWGRNKQQPKWNNQVTIWITINCEKRSVSQVARKTVMNDQQGPTGETT